VRRKWRKPAEKEWWFQKLAAARRRKLLRLSEQQRHRCCYCERLTWMFAKKVQSSLVNFQPDRRPGMTKALMATMEHIVAISDGGTEHDSNLAMACYRCNTLRGNAVSALEFCEIMHDSARYREFVTRGRFGRRQRKKNSPEKQEKRQRRYDTTMLSLASLAVVSPSMRTAITLWSQWIDAVVRDQSDRQTWRSSCYTEGAGATK
jgi:hypothetical protein